MSLELTHQVPEIDIGIAVGIMEMRAAELSGMPADQNAVEAGLVGIAENHRLVCAVAHFPFDVLGRVKTMWLGSGALSAGARRRETQTAQCRHAAAQSWKDASQSLPCDFRFGC